MVSFYARMCYALPGRASFRHWCISWRRRYGKDEAQQEYTTFQHALQRGYAVVIQDVRGRFHSEGEFRPYENEGRDGYDTIEWSAKQPWSNGAVGTFGLRIQVRCNGWPRSRAPLI